ncbi:MAG: RecX family transcriptional regulator, partial [Candidatus Marinimicrobia bacterium]|nr:RecX family transcriptional regulator [Candidatus Neomarinimicrobiota bacterium]
MKIERIYREKKKRRLVLLFDSREELSLSEDIVKKYLLKAGNDLDEDRINTLIEEDGWQRALDKSIELLSYRDHSRKEMFDKLKKKDFHPTVIARVIDYLEDKNYINDEKYTGKFVEELLNSR